MQSSSWVQRYLLDIRFWIILFFIVRLYGITNPPLDPASTWRQTDVLMIARNYYEVDSNILYPRIDLDGHKDGLIVAPEFPIFNYTIFLVAKVFGYQHWYGRIINLILSSIALWFFYRSVKRFFKEEAAFNATILLLFTGWFAYARITLPDIFGASLCIISLHFAFNFFEEGKLKDLLVFTLIAAVGCLSKITAASLLTVLLLPMLDKDVSMRRKVMLTGSAVVILGLVSAWYFYWVPYLGTLGSAGYYFMGQPVSESIQDILDSPHSFLKKIYDDPMKYTGTALLLFSIYFSIRQRKYLAPLAFTIAFLGFAVFVLKIGRWFHINGYYFVMMVPALTFMAGYGLSLLKSRKLQFVILAIVVIENIGNQVHMFTLRPAYASYVKLEEVMDQSGVAKDDLIAISNEHSPMAMYMCHRRGWNVSDKGLYNEEFVAFLKGLGCKYILFLKKIYDEDPDLPYEVVYDSEDFKVFKL